LFSPNVFFKINPQNIFNSSIVNNTSTVLNFNTQNSLTVFPSKEGRALQYVENTLLLPHTFSETIGTGLFTIGTYWRLLAWPDELSFYYGYATINTYSFLHLKVLSCLILLLLLLGISIYHFKKHPFIFIGFGWFICSILLFSNWVELVAGMVGERLAFNASAGFCLFIAASINSFKPILSAKKFRILNFIFVLLIILVSIRTVIRNADWKDPLTLMRKDILHLNQSAQAHNLLALNLMEVSTSESTVDSSFKLNLQLEAIYHFKRAAKIYPSFFNVWYDLGRVYTLHNNFSLAKSAFEKAYAIDNNSLLVLEELVKTCFNLKLIDELELYGTTYLKKDEFNEIVHELLAYIMFINNKFEKSIYYAKNGLNYYPNNRNLQLILSDSKK
jgi:tetratricopeptide (TPR) repeat protein